MVRGNLELTVKFTSVNKLSSQSHCVRMPFDAIKVQGEMPYKKFEPPPKTNVMSKVSLPKFDNNP